jgi:hypothetical protein
MSRKVSASSFFLQMRGDSVRKTGMARAEPIFDGRVFEANRH